MPDSLKGEVENDYSSESSEEDVPPEGTRVDWSQVNLSQELTQNLGIAEEQLVK